MEGKIARRLAVAGTIAALTLSGCATENQANGTNIVNCTDGQKTGELKTTLPFGETMNIGGATGGGANKREAAGISFEKGGGISIKPYYGDSGLKVIYFQDSTPELSIGEVGITKDGEVLFKDAAIDYKIKTSVNNNGGSLDIIATCRQQ